MIRQGELEAINIVVNNNGTALKGHYRIERSALDRYLESKKVNTVSCRTKVAPRTRRFPNVKNRLGL
ncbi:hypothetical protein ACFL6U_10870 [Planctomycetota bacterium]